MRIQVVHETGSAERARNELWLAVHREVEGVCLMRMHCAKLRLLGPLGE